MKKKYKLLPFGYLEVESRLRAVEYYINNESYPMPETIVSLLGFIPAEEKEEEEENS